MPKALRNCIVLRTGERRKSTASRDINILVSYAIIANMCKSHGISQRLSAALVGNIKMDVDFRGKAVVFAAATGLILSSVTSSELASEEELGEVLAHKDMQMLALYASIL